MTDAADGSSPRRTILVVGADGFIGGFIVSALRTHGWRVLRGVRLRGRPAREDERDCDFGAMHLARDWIDVVVGVDTVVNAAGILRERGGQRFDTVHVRGPLALAQACAQRGVRCFVQVSALGDPGDGAFIASKHRFDEALRQLPLSVVVLRPSLVYATSGSYGGTSLLRALAALPALVWLPGDGRWLVQPVAAEDLARLVTRAPDASPGIYEVVGPQIMTLRTYQQQWRHWLRIPGQHAVLVPEALVTAAVAFFDVIGRGPMGGTMWRMLRRGNVSGPSAHARLDTAFGAAPRALTDVLAARASQVQDRWHAQLYFVAPVLLASIVLLWLLSAWVGLTTPALQIERMAAPSPLAGLAPVALARAGGIVDLLLALCLATGRKPRLVIGVMTATVAVYTLVFGLGLPSAWLDPLGGLAKNLVVLPALATAWVLADRR